jgi:hypothetical protein
VVSTSCPATGADRIPECNAVPDQIVNPLPVRVAPSDAKECLKDPPELVPGMGIVLLLFQ